MYTTNTGYCTNENVMFTSLIQQIEVQVRPRLERDKPTNSDTVVDNTKEMTLLLEVSPPDCVLPGWVVVGDAMLRK